MASGRLSARRLHQVSFEIAGIDPLQRTRYGGAGTLEVTLGTTRQCNSLQSLGDILRMAARGAQACRGNRKRRHRGLSDAALSRFRTGRWRPASRDDPVAHPLVQSPGKHESTSARASLSFKPPITITGRLPSSISSPGSPRTAKTNAIGSARRRRATKARTWAEARSSHCASSIRQTSGRSSAVRDRRLSTARPTRKRSAAAPPVRPNAPTRRRPIAQCGTLTRSPPGTPATRSCRRPPRPAEPSPGSAEPAHLPAAGRVMYTRCVGLAIRDHGGDWTYS